MDDGTRLFNHIFIPSHRSSARKKDVRKYFQPAMIFNPEERATNAELFISNIRTAQHIESGLDFNLPYIFLKITTREDLYYGVHKQNFERLGFKWLNALSQNSVAVAVPKTKYDDLLKKLSEYGKSGKCKSYLDIVSKIEIIRYSERLSQEFVRIPPKEKIRSDINFFSDLTLEDYENAVEYVRKEPDCEIKFSQFEDTEMPFIRINTDKDKLIKIASNVSAIKKIEPVPKFESANVPIINKITDSNFESAADDLERVMVIDCGISHEHPGVRNVLIIRKNYIHNNDETQDIEDGHGTRVAGLAAYGLMDNSRILKLEFPI